MKQQIATTFLFERLNKSISIGLSDKPLRILKTIVDVNISCAKSIVHAMYVCGAVSVRLLNVFADYSIYSLIVLSFYKQQKQDSVYETYLVEIEERTVENEFTSFSITNILRPKQYDRREYGKTRDFDSS